MTVFKRTVVLTAGFILVASMAVMAKEKPTIAVLDFKNKTNTGGYELGSSASDMLTTALFKTKKFDVIDRDKLTALLKEQKMGMTGLVDSKAAQIGKLIGVEYFVSGTISEYGASKSGGGVGGLAGGESINYRAAVDVKVIHTSTGKICFAGKGEGSKKSTAVKIAGIGGGAKTFDDKKAQEALRQAIDDIKKQIQKEGLED